MIRAGIRVLALLAGMSVAVQAMAWKIVEEGQPFTHKGSGYTIQYPAGWRYVKMPFGDETIATRDGPGLQAISVDFRKHKNAFRALKKDATPEMMPQELAEKIVAEITTAGSLQNMQVLSDEPTTLAGRPAFRLHLAYRTAVDAGSVRYESIVVGANSPQGIFLVRYRAPVLHYFSRDVETCEKTLATFAIAELKPAR
jgi:hypothetical protein